MRVGSLVFATNQGLGILAKSFYDAGILTDVLIVKHGVHPDNLDWYPRANCIHNLRNIEDINQARAFCDNMDIMLFFETPFIWDLFTHCRAKDVRTVLMPMYECEFERLPAKPDLIINPSELDQRYYPRGKYLPVPVNYPWQQRHRAETFIHNAGHGGLKGRNGTAEFVEAAKLVRSPAKLILRSQKKLTGNFPRNLQVVCETVPREELFSSGDVFVFPEKFNGLSLPLQEARAAGMLVMAGDRFPINTWLPREPLIPVSGYKRNRIGPPYNEFDEAIYQPQDIASQIDAWYGRDISQYSVDGRQWAQSMSWDFLKPKYLEILNRVCS